MGLVGLSKFFLVFFVVSPSPLLPLLTAFFFCHRKKERIAGDGRADPHQSARGCFRRLCCPRVANRRNCGRVCLVPQAARGMRTWMRKWRIGILTALRSESAKLHGEKPSSRNTHALEDAQAAQILDEHPVPSPRWTGRHRPPPSPCTVPQPFKSALSGSGTRLSSEIRGRGTGVERPRHRILPGPAWSGSAITQRQALPSLLGANRLFHLPRPTPDHRAPLTWRFLTASGTSPRTAGKQPLPQGTATLSEALPCTAQVGSACSTARRPPEGSREPRRCQRGREPLCGGTAELLQKSGKRERKRTVPG